MESRGGVLPSFSLLSFLCLQGTRNPRCSSVYLSSTIDDKVGKFNAGGGGGGRVGAGHGRSPLG